MASRVVDGPDGGQFISAEDAARWLGLHPVLGQLLRREAPALPKG